MTMMQNLWPKATRRDSLHRTLVPMVWDILQLKRAEGATTGYMMTWIDQHHPAVATKAREQAPRGSSEADEIQYFKTAIGHALDEWQELGKVHCDSIQKRTMDGDCVSVPVWRTMEDWVALKAHNTWMMRPKRMDGKNQYAMRGRKLFEARSHKTQNT